MQRIVLAELMAKDKLVRVGMEIFIEAYESISQKEVDTLEKVDCEFTKDPALLILNGVDPAGMIDTRILFREQNENATFILFENHCKDNREGTRRRREIRALLSIPDRTHSEIGLCDTSIWSTFSIMRQTSCSQKDRDDFTQDLIESKTRMNNMIKQFVHHG